MIDEYTIRKVKDAANIVDVVRDFYDLKRDGQGGSWTCLCPFHEDRHLGSFKVSERRNIYKCFSCGEQGGPIDFLMKHENLTYPDAVRWLGKKYSIDVEGQERIEAKMKQCKPHEPLPPLPMLVLNMESVLAMKNLKGNVLVDWLRSLSWNDEQRKRIDVALKNYAIGQGKDGHTIFWQIDEKARVRTGKMMLYKPDGHRDKETPHNFDWVHSVLARAGRYNPDELQYETCLFGQHLLDYCSNATINLVESEKTALICAIAYGQMDKHLWMATGGMSMLNPIKLKPLIERGRHIVLYPDHDGVEKWRECVKSIGYEHLTINESVMKSYWKPEDGEKADIADVIVRLLKSSVPTLDEVLNDYPWLRIINDKLGLEIINIRKENE